MAKSNFERLKHRVTGFFIGIDIHILRKCCYAVMDADGALVESGWFSNVLTDAARLARKWNEKHEVHVGIDAPRMPIPSKRRWYWNRGKRRWVERRKQKGYGRHCEIVVSAHRVANPQWTPLEGEAPEWMETGFKLYSILEGLVPVFEVFPTASYALLHGDASLRVSVDFSACKPGPKDMLDAWVAAATVREFVEGRGAEVGGGDGFGTIILPRPLPEPVVEEVLHWPQRDGFDHLRVS